ncbi:glycosyltransferase family 4 protein [Oligoflexia bacterium]|nr:glycosyltransferase family 4 protein [Oligoflexia bacterium]
MHIGIIIGRIGGVDGVALETEKWIEVLERLGHEVYLLSGVFEKKILDQEKQTVLPILSFFSPECHWEQRKAFFKPSGRVEPIIRGLKKNSQFIAKAIISWIEKNKIDLLISQNASALPCHLSMGMGIKKAIEDSDIKVITHDHDFPWERSSRYLTPHQKIEKLINDNFPLNLPNVKHVVINSAAQHTLKTKFKIKSMIIPNVMDFDREYGELTDYNATLPYDLGLKEGDIPLLQVTRVVRRKKIETAFELIRKLNDGRIKLVITGSHRDDEGGHYFDFLLDYLHDSAIEDRIIIAADKIGNKIGIQPDGHKRYTLSDAYAHGVGCTYFSDYEGFGNAFVEAIAAKKPIFVNNYKPVYWPEIGSKGFKTVMIEDNNLTDKAVDDIREVIFNEKLQKKIVEHNYALGKKYFSYQVLQEKLETLLA